MIGIQLAEVIIHRIITFIDCGDPLSTLVEESLQLIIPPLDSPVLLDELLQADDRELQLAKRRFNLVFALEVSINDDLDEAEVVLDTEEVLVAKCE